LSRITGPKVGVTVTGDLRPHAERCACQRKRICGQGLTATPVGTARGLKKQTVLALVSAGTGIHASMVLELILDRHVDRPLSELLIFHSVPVPAIWLCFCVANEQAQSPPGTNS
jgi:hypothetical protein